MFRFRFLAVAVLLAFVHQVGAQAHVTKDPVANDGTPVQVDLPKELHMKNCGGSDGAGLCVFTSINHAAYWQNVQVLQQFQQWMKKHPGGGYPQKVDKTIAQIAKERNMPVPDYLNLQTNDLGLLRACLKSGRMPSITYSVSPTKRYGGGTIAHMVTLLAAGAGKGPDGKGWYCVLDNNFPGTYEWMSESQFMQSYAHGGTGWTVVLLRPVPPPVPVN